jgi:hypothetical protein
MIKKVIFYVFLVLLAVPNGILWYQLFAGTYKGSTFSFSQLLVMMVMTGASAIVLVPMGQNAFKKEDK